MLHSPLKSSQTSLNLRLIVLFMLGVLQSLNANGQDGRNFLHPLLARHIGRIEGANRHGKNLLVLFFLSGMPSRQKTTTTVKISLKFV
jgi:hypothetical protein